MMNGPKGFPNTQQRPNVLAGQHQSASFQQRPPSPGYHQVYGQKYQSSANSPMRPGIPNGHATGVPQQPMPRIQSPMRTMQPVRPPPSVNSHITNAAVTSNLNSNTSTNQNISSQMNNDSHLRNSAGLHNGSRTSSSPATPGTPNRPGIYNQLSSSVTATEVSGSFNSTRQPTATLPSQPSQPIPANINPQSYNNQIPPPQASSTVPGIPTSKRRAYPQQPAPSIPTSYNQPISQSATQHGQPNTTNQIYQQQTPQLNVQQTFQQQNPNQQSKSVPEMNTLMNRLSVEQSSTYPVNLLEQRQIVPPQEISPPKPPMSQDSQKKNARPEVLRCTLNAIPQTSSLLKQCKLPLGIYIRPFAEDKDIPIITSVITRCRSCRSYLNPFVSILDHRRWQCNMCFRVNDLPEELSYDYSTKQYMDVRRRPELTSASVEFIAPSEYMLRPPQPSVFVFVLDVSFNAISTGYLQHACDTIAKNIDKLPGDSRMKMGFITFSSSINFYSIKSSQSQPQMYVISDLEDVYLPVPDGLLVNVKENKDMILQLLQTLPTSVGSVHDTLSATGAAMMAAKKLVSSTGGRITVFQTCLPSAGPGKLAHREISTMTANSKDVQCLNPSTDFYKKFSLECAGEQIAVDLFLLAGQYCDLASMSGASRYSSGAIHYYPDFHAIKNPAMLEKFSHDFTRYLTRNIGFEAVMRLRCTKGLSIHTFHGNFFVRSTDLLSLPNVNPDHSFGMQIAVEDSLTESNMVGFQAALLYTTTKGERRIRVHTLSLPVTSKQSDVFAYADQEAVVSSLSKLAVDRTLMSSLGDAREALMNACIDCLKVYRTDVANQKRSQAVLAPHHLRLLPLQILALMKNDAFKLGSGVSLDSRVFSLLEYKWQPWKDLMLKVYPRLYSILDLLEEHDESISSPPILQASAEKLSRQGIYLMDTGKVLYLFVGRNVSETIIQDLFNVQNFNALPEKQNRLPELENTINVETRKFISKLRNDRSFFATLEIIREDTKYRLLFLNNLIDDRTESSMSYHEFLQHIQRQLNR